MQATHFDVLETRRCELQAAFAEFGTASGQLAGAFESLRAQVAGLRQELSESQSGSARLATRLAALIESLPGGVLLLDADGRIQQVNPAARDLLGESLAGRDFAGVLKERAVGFARSAEHVELHSGRFVNLSRRELGGGGTVVLLTDVTEAQLMQAVLARQQRLLTLGELAAGLAHQIRTPLAAALLYASQISLPGNGPDHAARCADKTVESLRQLDRLVNDMLAFAHGGAARETVSVGAVLEQVAQWLRPALRGGVRLTIRTEAPDLAVRANAPSLVSAVLNLATNALQSAAGDLELELLARRTGAGRAQIVVTDNGPGVPPPLRARIFEPFFTTRARGCGIGLAVVKSVVEAHDGSVRLAQSDAGAAGARFIIDLPAVAGA